MIVDYSPRYRVHLKNKKGVPGPKQRMTLGEWFWKLSGVVVICTTLIGLAGSFWFSWKIRNGLDDLSKQKEKRQELQQISIVLQGKEKVLFDEKRVEAVAAADHKLFPAVEKYIGGGITVVVPKQ